jgi:phage baseplate assembly protein W
MNIDFPLHFDSRGHTAKADDDNHIRDMIEQLIFTNPGERVNRPDFGSGLLQLIFAPTVPNLPRRCSSPFRRRFNNGWVT